MSEPDVDLEFGYSLSFPLPFRVFALTSLGILAWATNIHGLDNFGVDVVSALDLRIGDHHSPSQRYWPDSPRKADVTVLYKNVYRIFITYSVWCLVSWTTFRSLSQGNPTLVDVYGYIPAVFALLTVIILLLPFHVLFKPERDKFLHAIRRCISSSPDSPVYFADVVFADIFTSFAKVLGDVFISLRMLFPGNSLLEPPADHGWTRWIMPTIMSIPYLVRFRQCVIEWLSVDNTSRRPLANAVKYATAFPVMYLSAAQRLVVSDLINEKGKQAAEEAWHGEHPLFRLWLLFAAINSLYSFWWDVTNDWGLELLKPGSKTSGRPLPPRRLVLPHLHSGTALLGSHRPVPESEDHPAYPFGLRPTLLYPLPVYPLLVFLNLILRLTWSIKLSSHLHSKSEGSVAIFLIEVAEIVRRWMWVFVRVEWEVIKKAREARNAGRTSFSDTDEPEFEMITTPTMEHEIDP
ncbi:EXS family-domain-containing protein [Lentinula edodes]|uniref:EXS family-domain-containing protein n=1 Tax=Lentinula edodes TaxID=5353 RepID=UPI001E8D7021|nr:EXS family-domain-containing protein [Lentinula edodes]KAH7874637.1 EXS family-domain-containing protein [Lentinula edodes]